MSRRGGGGGGGAKLAGARGCLTVSACPTVLRPSPRPVPRCAMAGTLESVESCLEQHIPPEDLAEVKRILYGGEARWAARTGSPPSAPSRGGGRGRVPPRLPPPPRAPEGCPGRE